MGRLDFVCSFSRSVGGFAKLLILIAEIIGSNQSFSFGMFVGIPARLMNNPRDHDHHGLLTHLGNIDLCRSMKVDAS